jgi:hypothetical protein
VDRFNPEEVPTVLQLVEEIDSFAAREGGTEGLQRIKNYKKTSLKESVGIFEVITRERKGRFMARTGF